MRGIVAQLLMAIGVGAVASAAPAVRVTARVAAPCGPDYLERHATSLSDLDGDGGLDRVAFVRDADGYAVHRYALPGLHEAATWRLPMGYLEVATPRRRGGIRGDLWVTVGADAGGGWRDTLYHLDGGKLAAVSAAYHNLRIAVDVDGDGRVDPIGIDGAVVRALGADGAWRALPVTLPAEVHGVPVEAGQEEARDLDGDGIAELVLEHADRIEIVEAVSGKRVWSAKGKPWQPRLIRWGGAWVLVVRLDDQLRIYATDKGHALLGALPDAPSFAEVPAALGDELLVTDYPWRVYVRAAPAKQLGEVAPLAGRLDAPPDARAPFGPVRLAKGEAPGLVAVRTPPGGPAVVELLDPQTRAVRRQVWEDAKPFGPAHTLSVSLIDLDRDGVSELLLEQVDHVAFHHGSSWDSSRLSLIDGQGAPLWQEARARTRSWSHDGSASGRGAMTPTQTDETHARGFDLGDGTTALRIRSERDEYYLVAARSTLTAVPVCLE
jgi:hypothetical protein